MEIGQKISYKNSSGNTYSIERIEVNRYIIGGFDECKTLEEAKKSLEWLDSPRNELNPYDAL